MKKKTYLIFVTIVLFILSASQAQKGGTNLFPLSVEKIMRDPKWIGTSPSNIFWSEDGEKIYFRWNPEEALSDSLYFVSKDGGEPEKVTREERMALPSRDGDYDKERTRKVYSKNGDIFLLHIESGIVDRLTNTIDYETDPNFTGDEKKITFIKDDNLYMLYLDDEKLVQITNFQTGMERNRSDSKSEQDKWLSREALKLSKILKKRKEIRELSRKNREAERPKRPIAINIAGKSLVDVALSPDERFVTFILRSSPHGVKRTIVPQYVTESGYTETMSSRSKVGAPYGFYDFGIYDTQRDTVYYLSTDKIPGIGDKPEYLRNYKKQKIGKKKKKEKQLKDKVKKDVRRVMFSGAKWSEDGKYCVVDIFSLDNKDRWIMRLIPESGELRLLDRQHDEAWLGGPGIRSWWGGANIGWMPDGTHIWFQSEESGYSHLYTVDVETGEKRQLTSGKFEIYSPKISRDKKYWYFTANKEHPGVRHFYRMPIDGGEMVRITSMTGGNEAILSPDEKLIALRYSSSNRPWELYIMENRPGAEPQKITNSISDEFLSYPWRKPEVITFKARDGVEVYARLYRPSTPVSGGPGVIFVHGAGYLQNAHKWWSSYFREYMFNNLLADNGYYVLDIDYRGSAGYGRDWRTAIYRHMGGKDLTDQVDGAKFLVEKCGVDPKKIGIYGGSYGGFITLMAMFTEPDVFAAGAALRAVTDWAHYNHGYTSNILNTPISDSLAYYQSSPIYFAEGLKGALLMCHGMVDRNVHFQDIVRLTQRLIELGKENWELAVYPLEGHGFVEASSWTDEYRRIFKLFEENLK